MSHFNFQKFYNSRIHVIQINGEVWINGRHYPGLSGEVHVEEREGKLYINGEPEEYWSAAGGQQSIAPSGVAAQEKRLFSFCKKLCLQIPAELYLVQGSTAFAFLETDDNVLPLIVTEVSAEELLIKFSDRVEGQLPVRIFLSLPELTLLRINAVGCRVLAEKAFRGDRLSLEHNGADTQVDLCLDYDKVDTQLLGQGNIRLSGKVQSQSVRLLGQGEVDALQLISRECRVELLGQGNCLVHAEKKLKVSLLGMGSVQYSGQPEVEQQVLGMGRVGPVGG